MPLEPTPLVLLATIHVLLVPFHKQVDHLCGMPMNLQEKCFYLREIALPNHLSMGV